MSWLRFAHQLKYSFGPGLLVLPLLKQYFTNTIWGVGKQPHFVLGQKRGSMASACCSREISAVARVPADHFLVVIVKTQTFKIYLFIRSSCSFSNLGCINWECD